MTENQHSQNTSTLSNVIDDQKLCESLSHQGRGYYLSEKPLFSNELLTNLQTFLKHIRTEKMNILFNNTDVTDIISNLAADGESSIGSSSNNSSLNGRKYLTIEAIKKLLRNTAHKQCVIRMNDLMKEVLSHVSHCMDTRYVNGEQNFIRNVGLCQRQHIHCDSDPRFVDWHKPDLSVIIFLDNPARIEMFKNGHHRIREDVQYIEDYESMHQIIETLRGHCIIFRQDLPHCGSASMEKNHRVFFGFSTPRKSKRRPQEVQTFLVSLERKYA